MKRVYFLICYLLFAFPILAQKKGKKTSTAKTFKICEVTTTKKDLAEVSYRQAVENYIIHAAQTSKWQKWYREKHRNKVATTDSFTVSETLLAFSKTQDSLVSACKSIPQQTADGTILYEAVHPFMKTVERCYAEHRPLVISPDMIWLLICQGFAKHVSLNTAELQHLFVQHEGKKTIILNDFDISESSQKKRVNYYEAAAALLSDSMAQYIGDDLRHLISANFSTTTNIEKAAFDISLMDSMSDYFVFVERLTCGIPQVTLEGSPKDWKWIEKNIERFAAYDLKWWTDELKPVLKQFTEASKGRANVDFWKNIYYVEHFGCGSSTILGWSNAFFPYLKGKGRNPVFEMDERPWLVITYEDTENGNDRKVEHKFRTKEEFTNYHFKGKLRHWHYMGPEINLSHFGNGLSKADYIQDNNGVFLSMSFVAGFVGYVQNKKTKALRPEIAWAVVDNGREASKEEVQEMKDGLRNVPKKAKSE